MADVISWPGDLASLEEIRNRMRAGQIIAVAAEDGFDALAFGLDIVAVRRLSQIRDAEFPLAIGLGSVHEILDWLPTLRGAGIRLVRDFWPGPLALISALGINLGVFPKLPAQVQTALRQRSGIAVRLVRDDLAGLLVALGGPVVIATVPNTDRVDVILDTPPSERGGKTTVAYAGERDVKVIRAGSIRPGDLESSSRAKIVFICTGNTCRSPMAEGLCRKLLADTLGVDIARLSEAGFEIESAGLAAAEGDPASPEAVDIALGLGADLGGHVSQPLTMEMVDRADHLFTMTSGHLRMLHSLRLPVGPEPQMLSMQGVDVPDPIGGPLERYRDCAEQISASLRERLPQILEG